MRSLNNYNNSNKYDPAKSASRFGCMRFCVSVIVCGSCCGLYFSYVNILLVPTKATKQSHLSSVYKSLRCVDYGFGEDRQRQDTINGRSRCIFALRTSRFFFLCPRDLMRRVRFCVENSNTCQVHIVRSASTSKNIRTQSTLKATTSPQPSDLQK